MTAPAPPSAAPSLGRPLPRRRRSVQVLAGGAVLVALWLGVGAPSVSPVSPPLPAGVDAGDVIQVTDTDDGDRRGPDAGAGARQAGRGDGR